MDCHASLDPILSEQELAEWLVTSRATLQRQRAKGSGPPFIRLSERRVGYRRSAVEQWLNTRTCRQIGEIPVSAGPAASANSTRRGGESDVVAEGVA